MTTVSLPKQTATLRGASLPVQNTAQKILVIGQQTAAATATSGELQEDIGENESGALFGPPSHISNAGEAAKVVNTVSRLDAIGLDDPAGVAAAGTITFTAVSATESGSLTVKIGEERNGIFSLPIALADDEDTIATNLAALIEANTKCLCSAAAALSVVTVTAENVGLIGNQYGIQVTGSVGGVTYAIVGMTGGTLAPSLTNLFDVIGSTRYQTIVWPYEYGTTEVKTLLDGRFNVVNSIQDGIACMVAVDSKVNLVAAGAALNSNSLVIFGEKPESTSTFKGPSTFDSPLSQAAIFGGLRALRLSEDADISDYVVGGGGELDLKGGPAIASLPYFNSPLPLPVQKTGHGWTSEEGGEVDALNTAGISVMGNNTADNAVILGEVLTTYKTNAAAVEDLSWKFLNYVDTGSQSRELQFNNIKADASQHRATEGDLTSGRKKHNVESVTNLIIGYYGTLSGPAYVLLESGEDARKFFIANLTVTLVKATGKFTAIQKLPITTQFREMDNTMTLAFSL